MKEAKAENSKRNPNSKHLKALIRETFVYRLDELQNHIANSEPMVSTLLTSWPCFTYGEFLLEEFKLIMGWKGDKEMDEMFRKANKAAKALMAIVPKEHYTKEVNFLIKSIQILLNCICEYLYMHHD